MKNHNSILVDNTNQKSRVIHNLFFYNLTYKHFLLLNAIVLQISFAKFEF